MNAAAESLILALADDELVMGHRLSEWTGWVPYLEEDLAMSSIAQDELGHARLLYELLAPDGTDALALGRPPEQYRNAVLCERPNGDFAYTAARQYLYDTADDVRLAALERSSERALAERVRVIRIEEQYHVEHARTWFRRLAGGPVEARQRFADALAGALGEAAALFDLGDALTAGGLAAQTPGEMLETWRARVRADLEEADLAWVLESRPLGDLIPTSSGEAPVDEAEAPAPLRRGTHSEDFDPLWQELTGLYRSHPGARW